jgi:uncharacterized repeat protein (TIGR04052 family)
MKSVMKTTLLVPALALAASPCVAQSRAREVRIAFDAQFAGKPFACGTTYDNVGSSHARVKPLDLRFFISQVELLTADGNSVALSLDQDGIWQYRNLTLLDFEDGTGSCLNGNAGINKQILGTVPEGKYTGLRFTLGVPFDLDHMAAASAPSPLNTTAMFWSWQDGFKFLRAEVATVAPPREMPASRSPAPGSAMSGMGHANGFPVHIGSTGCAIADFGDAPVKECVHPNRLTVTFRPFDTDHDTVVFDFAKLLAGIDLDSPSPSGSPGCMSFPGIEACAAPLRALGLPFDGTPAAEQTVFTREARR